MPPRPNEPPTNRAARPATPGHAPSNVARQVSNWRRTLIPILLTLTVLLPALAMWFWLADIDSPFHQLPRWINPTLIAGGAVAGILAAMNMAAARSSRRR